MALSKKAKAAKKPAKKPAKKTKITSKAKEDDGASTKKS